MNLGKLFNFKYLKQNIKKSKGLLIVLTLLIPVITTLILIGQNTSEYSSATYPIVVSIANILGMYVIPVIISFILYGYVYKKNSVDFVNSMPLTRSTIFTTNFIGGIGIIFVMQVLTAIVSLVSALVLSNIYIAPAMILDIFIVMFLAYSFVFAATTIAMTVSGNFLTQLVVTLLIVFLIPFVFGVGLITIDRSLDIELANRIVTVTRSKATNYTLPSGIPLDGIGGEVAFYTVSRNVKTLILVIAYYGIGLYLFNKRKMENVGISFSKLWVHLLVKAITLVPMVFVIELLRLNGIFFCIAVILIFIYYCLYDFITNRKVSIKYTIPCFIASFLILVGVFNGLQFLGGKLLHETISIDDIKGISINPMYYSDFSSFYRDLDSGEFEYYVEDEAIVKTLCEAIRDSKNMNYWTTNDWRTVRLGLKLKNGSKKYVTAIIKYKVATDVVDQLQKRDDFLQKYDKYSKLPEDSYIMLDNNSFLSAEDTKALIDIYNSVDINKKLQVSKQFSPYGNYRNYIPQPNFYVYYYKNHDLHDFLLNPFLSQELFDKMNEISKKMVLKKIDELESFTENKFLNAYIHEKRVNTYSEDLEEGISFDTTVDLKKYIRDHANEKLNMTDSFYVVNINATNIGSSSIFLKETDELNYIIQKDKSYHIYYDEYPDDYYDDLEMEDTNTAEEVELINE